MSDEHLNEVSESIIEGIVDFDNHEIRGFRRTIAEDVQDMLIESNPSMELNNKPKLTLILITSIHSKDPCSSCVENLSNISEWAIKNSHFDNSLRMLMIDSVVGFDDKRIWEKLKVSFDDVPLTLFFDESFGLIDVVQGVMSVNYLNLFWSPHFE